LAPAVSRIYAALAPFGGRGDVYEVDLDDPIEREGVLGGASGDSVCAPSATVIQVVERHIRGQETADLRQDPARA
jgi:hypothetical protein